MVKIGMIFPGQGIQNFQSILELNKENNIIQNTFEEASEYLNYNLWNQIQKDTEIIYKSNHIQNIILTSSVSIYRLWKKLHGINPVITSGHSLGEYSALVCGKSICFIDAIKLLKYRAKIVKKEHQNQILQMKVIMGLNQATVAAICKKNLSSQIVDIASINTKDQIVISGHYNGVTKISNECKKIGAKTFTLPINIAAHCKIMKNFTRKFYKKIKLTPIKQTKYKILNSISVKIYSSKKNIRKSLVQQMYKPVQWYKTIKYISQRVQIIMEIGSNNILTTINKRNHFKQHIAMNNIKNFYKMLTLI